MRTAATPAKEALSACLLVYQEQRWQVLLRRTHGLFLTVHVQFYCDPVLLRTGGRMAHDTRRQLY